MEGSNFSILPLLILLFLASPVIIPNFSVMQHLVWGKLVKYWGNFKNGGRKCMSFLDFCFSNPVIQLPIFMFGGGSATALLMQHSIKFISKTFGNSIIFDGTHYLSLYLYIILIQLLGTNLLQYMKRIRGKRSGLKPQKSHWEFTQLDLAFMWVFNLILMISPMSEWVGKYACDILYISRAWLNMLIGIYLWVCILITLRLTYFLTDQRSKFKLFIIAILLCLLSINTEKTDNDGLWQPCHKYKLESTPWLKVNNNQEPYINQKKFEMSNVQHSVRERRQREFLQTDQSATLKFSLIGSPILRLFNTGNNIYQWTTKQRDRSEEYWLDKEWVFPQLFATTGQSTMALTPMLVAVEQISLTDNRWVRPQLTAAAGQSTMALTPMLVAVEQQSYGTSGQPNWPAGVSPMMKTVSFHVMSRWSTRTYPPANAWTEVSRRWVLMLRPHHPNEEDNPSSGYSEREVEDYTEHSSGQRATASSVSIGKYIHAVILMCGLMLYDQCEQHRKSRRYDSSTAFNKCNFACIDSTKISSCGERNYSKVIED